MPLHSNSSAALLKSHIPITVKLILKDLKEAGHRGFIVGGAVRDAHMQRPITDWDVATSATPEEIKSLFRDRKYFALKHGTVTLVSSEGHFEITTFRGRDKSLGGDLAHRDFTINAMAFDPDTNEILDPHGGKGDIDRKLVRAVVSAEARFKEDPIRLLRAVRFATELGFRIERRTLEGLINLSSLINSVAPERVREELLRLLMSPRPSTGFYLMVRTGLLSHVLPELYEGYLKRQNPSQRYTIFRHIVETIDLVEPVPVLRLAALFHDIAKPRVREKVDGKWRFYGHEEASASLAEEIMFRFRFSKEVIRRTTNLIRHHNIYYDSGWSDGAVRRLICGVGQEAIWDLIALLRSDILAHGLHKNQLRLLPELEERVTREMESRVVTNISDLAINGRKVMEFLGLSPGSEVGRVLKCLMEEVTDHPELNNQEGLLGLLGHIKGD
jgi:tRNA nucleotidyltransferase (CCA-adding enzyme)